MKKAYANANIALVKYWGKSNSVENIPAVPSLSLTIDDFGVEVTVATAKNLSLTINNVPQPNHSSALIRLEDFLSSAKIYYSLPNNISVKSTSNVPFASGLASSAAFFAALSCAIEQLFELKLNQTELSKLARIGSASAARSIFGGIAGLHGGNITHDQAFAYPIIFPKDVNFSMIIIKVSYKEKPISSRKAMLATKDTSPFFSQFVNEQESDMENMLLALKDNNLAMVGSIMEHSTLKMFSTMWTAKPAINYWLPESLLIIQSIYQIRKIYGPIVFFTMDAGPNVKLICNKADNIKVKKILEKMLPSFTFTILKAGLGAKVHE